MDDFPIDIEDHTSFNRSLRGSLRQSMVMPKLSMPTFDGDPNQWDFFISTFNTFVHGQHRSNAIRVAYLTQLLAPSVRERVKEFLVNPATYPEAIRELKAMYGDPDLRNQAQIDELMNMPTVKQNCLVSLIAFSDKLRVISASLISSGDTAELRSKALTRQVVAKLPPRIRDAWGKVLIEYPGSRIEELDKWLQLKFKRLKMANPE